MIRKLLDRLFPKNDDPRLSLVKPGNKGPIYPAKPNPPPRQSS